MQCLAAYSICSDHIRLQHQSPQPPEFSQPASASAYHLARRLFSLSITCWSAQTAGRMKKRHLATRQMPLRICLQNLYVAFSEPLLNMSCPQGSEYLIIICLPETCAITTVNPTLKYLIIGHLNPDSFWLLLKKSHFRNQRRKSRWTLTDGSGMHEVLEGLKLCCICQCRASKL